MSIHRGLHTLLSFRNFYIPTRLLDASYENTRVICRHLITKNNLRIVGEASKLLNDTKVSPEGWTMAYLLDTSHVTLHSFTSRDFGFLEIDVFTCCPNPESHLNCVEDLNKYFVENHSVELVDKQTITTRF
jgi:S-adenosylmethionine/arginine decarboxylase-like enzyme